MSFHEEYYKKFIDLQEKLRESEAERLNLELKFNEMLQYTRKEEQNYARNLHLQYRQHWEEDRKRRERNDSILRSLERIENRIALITAKTEAFKILRNQYHDYLRRSPVKFTGDPYTSRILEKNLQNLSLEAYKGLLRNEYTVSERLDFPSDSYRTTFDDFRPIYVNSIADDVIDAIQTKISRVSFPELSTNLSKSTESLFQPSKSVENYLKNDFSHTKSSDNLSYSTNEVPLKYDFSDNFSFTEPITKIKEVEISDSSDDSIIETEPKKVEYHVKFNKKSSPREFNTKSKRLEIQFKFNKHLGRKRRDNIRDKLEETKEKLNKLLIKYRVNQYDRKYSDNYKTEREEIFRREPLDLNYEYKPLGDLLQERKSEIDDYSRKPQEFSCFKPENNIKIQQRKHAQVRFQLEDCNEPLRNKDMFGGTPVAVKDLTKIREDGVQENVEEIKNVKNEDKESVQTEKKQVDEKAQFVELEEQVPVQYQYDEKTEDVKNPPIQYDEKEKLIQYKYEEEVPSSEYQYEGNEQSVEYQYDKAGAVQYDENQQPIQYQYEEKGELIQYDENGQPIQYQYDEKIQPVQYDKNGQPIQYDESGQPIQYDENAQLEYQYDENGQPIQYQYDENGQIIQYDEHGQIIQYDANGQPIQYDENGQPIQYQYDENGQIIQYDENGQPIQYQYDANGQPIQYQYDENGQPIQYAYDEKEPIQQYEGETSQVKDDEKGQSVEDDSKIATKSEESPNDSEEKTEEIIEKTSKDTPVKVMEMLDTDTESVKQDTKVSNDSDFDFSNG